VTSQYLNVVTWIARNGDLMEFNSFQKSDSIFKILGTEFNLNRM